MNARGLWSRTISFLIQFSKYTGGPVFESSEEENMADCKSSNDHKLKPRPELEPAPGATSVQECMRCHKLFDEYS